MCLLTDSWLAFRAEESAGCASAVSACRIAAKGRASRAARNTDLMVIRSSESRTPVAGSRQQVANENVSHCDGWLRTNRKEPCRRDKPCGWTRPQEYYEQSPWGGTWEFDGGAFMNQASHYVDLIQWIVGPVDNVMAKTATLARKIETEDSGVAILRFRSGALGVIEVTMLTY